VLRPFLSGSCKVCFFVCFRTIYLVKPNEHELLKKAVYEKEQTITRSRRLFLVLMVVAAFAGLFLWQINIKDQIHITEQHHGLIVVENGPTLVYSSGERLLEAVNAQKEGSWSFALTRADKESVGYDPCREVFFVLYGINAPEWAEEALVRSLQVLQNASGLKLTFEGYTTEKPNINREPWQPDRYGDRWAPVLVGWASENDLFVLKDVAGIGGSVAVEYETQEPYYVTGNAYMSLEGPLEREGGEPILLHELAHVLGLDHVDDQNELMHPTNYGSLDLGPGDMYGLSRLGSIPCAPVL